MSKKSKRETRQKRATRQCLFCRRAGSLTREHMWPVWMHRYLDDDLVIGDPHTPRERHSSRFAFEVGDDGAYEFRQEPVVHLEQGYPKNKTFPVVCEQCNGGWMKALEDQVSDFGGAMIRGERLELTAEQVHTLATWASLRAMVMELIDHKLVGTSAAQRWQLYETGRPPMVSRIWIGRYQGTEWKMRVRHNAMGLRTTPIDHPHVPPSKRLNTQTSTIVAGELLVYVFSTTIPSIDIHISGGPVHDLLTPIWPRRPRPLKWPPTKVVGDLEALGISDGLLLDGLHQTSGFLGVSTDKG